MNKIISQTEANKLAHILKKNSPYDEGDLNGSISSAEPKANSWIITIGGKYVLNKFVDYAAYTNDPWRKGNNPNEGWIERSIEEWRRWIINNRKKW